MKTLKNLKGVKEISKNEQKSISGGREICKLDLTNNPCPYGWDCYGYKCVDPNPPKPELL